MGSRDEGGALRIWEPGRPVSATVQLGPLRRGTGDPTWARHRDGSVWHATQTPFGAATERLAINSAAGTVACQAWGPGASWVLERLPHLFGYDDDPTGFEPPDVLRQVARRYANWRVPTTKRVMEALVPAILEQKVTGKEAWDSWRTLVYRFGERAPYVEGMPRLHVAPTIEQWKAIPSWGWHQAGVDSKRSTTIMRALAVSDRLESCIGLTHEQAHARLRSVSGVGIWTAAEVAQRALGDADAVSYGDYHVAGHVVLTLTGESGGTDEQMRELLTPYAPHRYRIQRLVELGGVRPERHGPRRTVPDMSGI